MNVKMAIIIIENFEDKMSKDQTKRYTRFKTNEGWMSAFEKDVIEKLKDACGKAVDVTLAESERDGRVFKNIRGFNKVCDKQDLDKEISKRAETFAGAKVKTDSPQETKGSKSKPFEKDPVGLAIDVYKILLDSAITLKVPTIKHDELMSRAIDLVKQAQKGFE